MLAAEDVPTEYCSVHVEESLCYANGAYHIATEACERLGDVKKFGMLNYARQFPHGGITVSDQQYCIGYLAKQAGYSEPRCNTLDPVNELCPVHTSSAVSRTARGTDDVELLTGITEADTVVDQETGQTPPDGPEDDETAGEDAAAVTRRRGA